MTPGSIITDNISPSQRTEADSCVGTTVAGGFRRQNKKSKIWLEIAMVHLLPLGITAALGGVYYTGLGWNANVNEINLLLIAGKVYEYMILASLSSFMLHRIRTALRSSCGVPLGFLTAPFRVNAAVLPYLIGRQFSTGAWSRAIGKGAGGGDVTTKMLIIAVSALAIAAAPSSSILVLPKLDWWPIATPTAFISNATTRSPPSEGPEPRLLVSGIILLNGTLPQLYPQILDVSTVRRFCDYSRIQKQQHKGPLSALGTQSIECPYAGLSEILSGLPQILALNYVPEYMTNLSMSGRDHTRHISLGWKTSPGRDGDDVETDAEAVAYATTPPDFVSRQLHIQGGNVFWQQSRSELKTVSAAAEYGLSQEYSSDTSQLVNRLNITYKRWHQPVVATECAPLVAAVVDTEIPGPSPRTYSADFTVGPHALLRIAMPDFRSDEERSRPQSDGNSAERGLTEMGTIGAVACSSRSIMRHKSNISVDPSSALQETFHNFSDVLTISDDWLSILDTALTSINGSVANSGLTELEAACKGEAQRSRYRSIAHSLYLTDALARVQYHRQAYECKGGLPSLARSVRCQEIWNNGDEERKSIFLSITGLKGFIGLSSTYYRRQYGYGIKGLTVSLAWIIVMLHAVLVLAHITEHIVRKKTYQKADRSDVGELVAGALIAERTSHSVCMDPRAEEDREMWRLRVNVKSSVTHTTQEI